MASPTMTELQGALGVLNQIINQTNDYNKNLMEEYGLTEDFCEYICTMSEDEINALTLSQINSYLAQYGIDSSNILQIFAKGDNSVSTLDKWKDFFIELRKAARDMDESLATREELQEACDEVYAAQTEFLRSAEYKEAYEEKISKIRRLAEHETDPSVRKSHLKKLDALQKSKDLTFLLARLDDPLVNKKNPNRELERLIDIFFDKESGQYMMKRYTTTAQKLGLNPQYHVNLYDIEEKFLSEPFYPLNNFFLFVVMSFVAHINPEDEIEHLYAITVISMMGNLLMGELGDDETNTLLGMVRNIENRILANDRITERFRQNNTTWKEHPIRKELDAKRAEMKYRLDLIDEIKGLLNGFGVNLVDGTELTAKNASSVLRSMDTKQIEGIRDDIKVEAEKYRASSELENMEGDESCDNDTSSEEDNNIGNAFCDSSDESSISVPASDINGEPNGGDSLDSGETPESLH